MREEVFYVIIPIKGVNINADLPIYSAAIYGNGPNYNPTKVGVHEKFNEPFEITTKLKFSLYQELSELEDVSIDMDSLDNLKKIKQVKTLGEFTCLAFEFMKNINLNDGSDKILEEIIQRGERIFDILRLFLFKPGGELNIGIVGMIENGIYGAWIGE